MPIPGVTAPATHLTGGAQVWSPVKRKMNAGQKVYSATVSGAATPEQYCTQAANPIYDFIWTEMQHSPGTWQNVATMWNTCPGSRHVNPESKSNAMAGASISQTTEFDIQHATDMGAMVIVVPTMDDVAEARDAVKWTQPPADGPPLGGRQCRRPAGLVGQAPRLSPDL